MTKREKAIATLKVAGYHQDKSLFTKVYIENRLNIQVAQQAYEVGYKMKQNGMKCNCCECTA